MHTTWKAERKFISVRRAKKHDMKINLSTFMYRVLISTVVFQKYDSRSKIITCFQEIWVSMLGMTFETIPDFNHRVLV